MSNSNSFLNHYAPHQKNRARADQLNKAAVFDALNAAGITNVAVEFDGEGDDGQMNDITTHTGELPAKLPSILIAVHRAPWEGAEIDTEMLSLREAIETLCYDYLTELHEGWDNGDGAYGSFALDAGKRTIHLEFNERFTDVTSYSHEF
jgi:hypothetical protein